MKKKGKKKEKMAYLNMVRKRSLDFYLAASHDGNYIRA